MIYFALGCAALAFFVWLGRARRFGIGSGWRIGAGVMAVAAFAGAAFVTMRGLWGTGIVLAVVGLGFLASARRQAVRAPSRQGGMSIAEACDLLGVAPDATPAEIKAAYVRLMQRAHPDAGGSKGLATQLNAARDVLLKRR